MAGKYGKGGQNHAFWPPSCLPLAAFCKTKGRLLRCKRPPFASLFAANGGAKNKTLM